MDDLPTKTDRKLWHGVVLYAVCWVLVMGCFSYTVLSGS